MYAAAGGASLASRQARKRQQQQNTKDRELKQKQLATKRTAGTVTPTKAPTQSKPFHQLPQNYLRTPNAQARKLSASCATQSRQNILCPISEGNSSSQQQTVHHIPRSPSRNQFENELRRSELRKSATASLPLVSQAEATPPSTPTQCYANTLRPPSDDSNLLGQPIHIQIPYNQDGIIVTPATPLASPLQLSNQLERKCSVYRGRELSSHEDNFYNKTTTITTTTTTVRDFKTNDEYNTFSYGMPNGHHHHHKWTDADYCDSEHRHLGVCTCDHVECAQGRAAWLERGRRCSVQENPASCHRRWVKRNRIHDSSLGGSSDDEDLLGVLRGPSAFANAFLYVGLGTVSLGLIIAFVGTGEKGFKTVELRLIGPTLIVIGLVCCILRILFCICPSHCISSTRRARKKKNAKVDADHRTSLLRCDSAKRVQIARGSNSQTKLSQFQKPASKTFSKTNESVEALRQIATTSLFLQSEKIASTKNRTVPIIQEPDKNKEEASNLEMKVIDSMSIDIYSLTDDEQDIESKPVIGDAPTIEEINENKQSKLMRQRAPINKQPNIATTITQDPDTVLMETSLIIINPAQSNVPSTCTTTIQQIQQQHTTQIQHPQQYHQPLPHQQQIRSLVYPSTSLHIPEPQPSTTTEIVLSPANLGH